MTVQQVVTRPDVPGGVCVMCVLYPIPFSRQRLSSESSYRAYQRQVSVAPRGVQHWRRWAPDGTVRLLRPHRGRASLTVGQREKIGVYGVVPRGAVGFVTLCSCACAVAAQEREASHQLLQGAVGELNAMGGAPVTARATLCFSVSRPPEGDVCNTLKGLGDDGTRAAVLEAVLRACESVNISATDEFHPAVHPKVTGSETLFDRRLWPVRVVVTMDTPRAAKCVQLRFSHRALVDAWVELRVYGQGAAYKSAWLPATAKFMGAAQTGLCQFEVKLQDQGAPGGDETWGVWVGRRLRQQQGRSANGPPPWRGPAPLRRRPRPPARARAKKAARAARALERARRFRRSLGADSGVGATCMSGQYYFYCIPVLRCLLWWLPP